MHTQNVLETVFCGVVCLAFISFHMFPAPKKFGSQSAGYAFGMRSVRRFGWPARPDQERSVFFLNLYPFPALWIKWPMPACTLLSYFRVATTVQTETGGY